MTRSETGTAAAIPLPSPKERRRLREAKSLSEQQVATALGVTRATVRLWETGRSNPRGRKREAYARLIGAAARPPADPPADVRQRASAGIRTKPAAPSTRPMPATATLPPGAAGPAPRTTVRDTRSPSVEAGGSRTVSPDGPEAPPDPTDPTDPPVPPEPPDPPEPLDPPEPAGPTAGEAFDVLYTRTAPGLVHQTYLLTGRRSLSREAVERAFQLAWHRWPEVARDRDPAGWVRAAAYEYAMSPWHRLRRAHRHPDAPPEEPGRRALLGALLDLPPVCRRTLLLYDGVGLGLPETAAETEASTPAAANRLMLARAALAERVPELASPSAPGEQSALVRERLRGLALAEQLPEPPPATTVRTRGERKAALWTRAAICLAALLISTTVFTLYTAPTQYVQPLAPAERVGGVPPRGGPQKLTPQDLKLQKSLSDELVHGPERLVPRIP